MQQTSSHFHPMRMISSPINTPLAVSMPSRRGRTNDRSSPSAFSLLSNKNPPQTYTSRLLILRKRTPCLLVCGLPCALRAAFAAYTRGLSSTFQSFSQGASFKGSPPRTRDKFVVTQTDIKFKPEISSYDPWRKL
jgi:hypothetical protein